MTPRVLVLGGYGAFGARAVERLARHGDVEIIIAGRSQEKAQAFAGEIAHRTACRTQGIAVDTAAASPSEFAALAPAVIINASGPYQAQDYRVAELAIACRAHYVDLSDASGFATGITALDASARAAHVLVASGASSVPSLSAAVVDRLLPRFRRLREILTVISPGNSFDPGLATTRSILGNLGRPIPGFSGGRTVARHGWQGLARHVMPGLGTRWICDCDAPDLTLFPSRYPGIESVRVCAALEVKAFHISLWLLSHVARAGLLRNPASLARLMLWAKSRLHTLGSDTGGMTVTLLGEGQDGKALKLIWSLVARERHGPNIPAIPAVIITRKLLAGTLATRGAMPAVGLFQLQDFRDATVDLAIVDAEFVT